MQMEENIEKETNKDWNLFTTLKKRIEGQKPFSLLSQ